MFWLSFQSRKTSQHLKEKYSTKLFYCNTWLNLISPSIFAQISISIPFLNSLGNSAFKTAQDIEFWWNIKGVMSKKPKKTKIQKHQIFRCDFSWYARSCPSEKWQKSENCLKMDIFFYQFECSKSCHTSYLYYGRVL